MATTRRVSASMTACTFAENRWERRAGRRSLRAELLNWLVSFADVARLDAEDGAGAPQDLAAARAVRPTLHTHVAVFCEDDDPQVREAAIAATALLLADPTLAASIPCHVPVVHDVLARSADSYYRWIVRERLESWGEDTAVLITEEEECRAAVDRAHALADDPFDEGQEQAIQWLAEQPEDTAALESPDRTAPEPAAPHEPAPEPPTAAQGRAPGYRGPWRIAGDDKRDEWTFTPYVGVGPLTVWSAWP
ncbi:hypothetical protein [Kitasatospora sp. NPDC008115]|uniref:hypothetical protein n=1 Tax=Kitasatospora sp. NPDC008115 TaxID=3364022 RepID=UPI0036E62344